jgi:hypothetical protein
MYHSNLIEPLSSRTTWKCPDEPLVPDDPEEPLVPDEPELPEVPEEPEDDATYLNLMNH